jgi:hypothetical protein
MELDESVIRRLAFIKYLYRVAYEQSQRPEPICGASVLTFHDAMELFLQLASECFDAGKERPSIIEYWDLLSPKLPEGGLTQKEPVRRLNRARVALKHHGNLPSKSDIEAFRATATNFFEENTRIIWDIEFNDVSLVELVKCEAANSNLREAEKLLQQEKIEESLGRAAIAFRLIMDEYESTKKGEFGFSPFFFGEDFTFTNSFFMGLHNDRLSKFVDQVIGTIEELRDALKILSLGIDYRRYVKFRLLTPELQRGADGNYEIREIRSSAKRVPSGEDARFCIDYVIESAIVLQEFDFEIEEYWR